MRAKLIRTVSATVTLGAAALLLSGCTLLDALYDQGPPRDSNGAITETKVVPATTLIEGDCFSFIDGTVAEVTASPCSAPHTHIIVGQGELTDREVNDAGGMQNAVSAACAESFDAFKATLAEGVKSELEFLVAELEHDGETWNAYSCVATDGGPA